MAKKIVHKKIRNTGLLFEFLLRQITSDVLDKKKKSAALKLIKEKFNFNTELGQEWSLYNLLINKKFNSDKKANYFINEVLKVRTSLNLSQLRREKYNLIREIKDKFDINKLFSSKIPNYKIYASIYKLFEHDNELLPEEKTETYFNIMENITTKSTIKLSEMVSPNISQNGDLRILTYKIMLEKFNQKYSHLDSNQKNLLRFYINNVSNTNSLKEYIEQHIPKLKQELLKYSKKVDDKISRIKLDEVIKSISILCGTNISSPIVKDSSVLQMIRYYELLKQLKKSG
jgi:hypothetical protein|tara:strand:+ start:6089 stop:6949 length:861 start_codon:yes stop_codon:yes gene_type:complete